MRAIAYAILPCALWGHGSETIATRQDQVALAITIYNDNLALVRDTRDLKLPKGDLDLAYQEVSAQIRPETAMLCNLSQGKGFWVNEQNFDFDLLSPHKILEKYIGRKVLVCTTKPNPDKMGAVEVQEEAEVVATNEGTVLRFKDRIETAAPGRIVFPDLPANLRSRPTLVLNLHSPAEKACRLELTYLTGGLAWRADYVANLAADEKSMNLTGWVTLTNRSGAAYPNTTLQLVAGDVHQAPNQVPMRAVMETMAMNKADRGGAPMREESLFEYHLYTLDRPTTLLDNQTKQVALLGAQAVPCAKDYVLQGAPHYYQGKYSLQDTPVKVGVFVNFANRAEAGLGMPLPKGTVRVYKKDEAGHPQFVGEDAVDHTPKGETVRLKLGDAFDITGKRKQTDFQVLGAQGRFRTVYETAFRVELKNAKGAPVTVAVLEPMPGDWEILDESHPHTKDASGMARFQVPVPAGGSATLTYRAKVRW